MYVFSPVTYDVICNVIKYLLCIYFLTLLLIFQTIFRQLSILNLKQLPNAISPVRFFVSYANYDYLASNEEQEEYKGWSLCEVRPHV
jgi:hypothetical protein